MWQHGPDRHQSPHPVLASLGFVAYDVMIFSVDQPYLNTVKNGATEHLIAVKNIKLIHSLSLFAGRLCGSWNPTVPSQVCEHNTLNTQKGRG